MYRILLVAKEGKDISSFLYKYLTIVNTEGKVVPYEANSMEEVDKQVELMLNGDYKKKDIVVIQEYTFDVLASLAENTNNDVTS